MVAILYGQSYIYLWRVIVLFYASFIAIFFTSFTCLSCLPWRGSLHHHPLAVCVCVLMCLCVYKFFFPIYGFGFRDFVAAFSLGTFDNTAGVLTFRDVSSSGPGQAWGHCVWGTWLIFTSLLFPVVSFFLWWPLASLLKECLQRKHQRAPELQGGEERRS